MTQGNHNSAPPGAQARATTWADEVRRLMALKSLTQRSLSTKTGISVVSINRMLRGLTLPHRSNAKKVHEAVADTAADREYLLALLDGMSVSTTTEDQFRADVRAMLSSRKIAHVEAKQGAAHFLVRRGRRTYAIVCEPDVSALKSRGAYSLLGAGTAARAENGAAGALIVCPYVPIATAISPDILRESGVIIVSFDKLTDAIDALVSD